jgi:hypothetical protein
MRFRFIEDRRVDYPVTVLCDVLGVSPAGYYAWRSNVTSLPTSKASTTEPAAIRPSAISARSRWS